ncbi:MAG: alpha/beta hydrolase [Planctomycetota bacterium]
MKLLLLLPLLVLLFWLWVRWLERWVLFQPSRRWQLHLELAGPDAEEITFSSEDGVALSGVWIPHLKARGVILFCHGNAGNLSSRIPQAVSWRQLGYSVLLFDYRGYGRSAGTPSESGVLSDARSAWQEAERRGMETPILFGRSLGAFAAIRLAGERQARGLVIDSAFISARAMAKLVLPVPGLSWFMSLKLDNLEAIPRVRCPLLVMHGELDEVVPFQHGRELFNAAPEPKSFLPLPGLGHNDSREQPAVERALDHFLEALPRSPAHE